MLKPSNPQTASLAAVEAYLAVVPEPARTTLLKVRESIRAAAPKNAIEEIGYGVPAFRAEQLIAGYAAGKRFCSYYPMSGRVITKLAEDLQPYKTTKGSIHFAIDKPLPVTVVRKLVKARIDEIAATK